MIVKACKGLNFIVQGQRVSETIEAYVKQDHDVCMKLIQGSLIEVKEVPIKEEKIDVTTTTKIPKTKKNQQLEEK
jgi:hypothetical protein